MGIEKRIDRLNARIQKLEEQLKKVENKVPFVNIVPRELFQFQKAAPKPDDALRTACEVIAQWNTKEMRGHAIAQFNTNLLCDNIEAIKSALAAPEVGEVKPREPLILKHCDVHLTLQGDIAITHQITVKPIHNILQDEISTLIAWLSAQVPKNGGE